jgi:hypothetical protein
MKYRLKLEHVGHTYTFPSGQIHCRRCLFSATPEVHGHGWRINTHTCAEAGHFYNEVEITRASHTCYPATLWSCHLTDLTYLNLTASVNRRFPSHSADWPETTESQSTRKSWTYCLSCQAFPMVFVAYPKKHRLPEKSPHFLLWKYPAGTPQKRSAWGIMGGLGCREQNSRRYQGTIITLSNNQWKSMDIWYILYWDNVFNNDSYYLLHHVTSSY